jgi:glutaminyl-peptide cyclotransferase
MQRSGRRWIRAVALGGAACGCLVIVLVAVTSNWATARGNVSSLKLEDIPFDGARAYEYLRQICALGRRPSGSPGMEAQQKLLIEHFTKLGAKAELQRFRALHPGDGSQVPMANLIVQWHPQSKERILICTHYDTLPYPMMDRVNPRGVFVGANDGGSGVALLMALGHDIPKMPLNFGVDFIFFDGEEFIFQTTDTYFLGSEFFATNYAKEPPGYRYRWGVLLDMVGGTDLQLYQERNSTWWADTRPLVDEIWATARRLGVREFIARRKHEVRDDHLPLHNIAHIPTCDVIDFDYPYWHTQGDTPEHCSALSLAKVGWVIRQWLAAARPREM